MHVCLFLYPKKEFSKDTQRRNTNTKVCSILTWKTAFEWTNEVHAKYANTRNKTGFRFDLKKKSQYFRCTYTKNMHTQNGHFWVTREKKGFYNKIYRIRLNSANGFYRLVSCCYSFAAYSRRKHDAATQLRYPCGNVKLIAAVPKTLSSSRNMAKEKYIYAIDINRCRRRGLHISNTKKLL